MAVGVVAHKQCMEIRCGENVVTAKAPRRRILMLSLHVCCAGNPAAAYDISGGAPRRTRFDVSLLSDGTSFPLPRHLPLATAAVHLTDRRSATYYVSSMPRRRFIAVCVVFLRITCESRPFTHGNRQTKNGPSATAPSYRYAHATLTHSVPGYVGSRARASRSRRVGMLVGLPRRPKR